MLIYRLTGHRSQSKHLSIKTFLNVPSGWFYTSTLAQVHVPFPVQVRFFTLHAPAHVSFNHLFHDFSQCTQQNDKKTYIFLFHLEPFCLYYCNRNYNDQLCKQKKICIYILLSTLHACNINFVYVTFWSYMHMCK